MADARGQPGEDSGRKSPLKKPRQFNHPVDHGWAWVIMAAAFGIHFMSMGYERSFGILFVEYQEYYGTSASMTSAISGAKSFVYCLATMLAMNYAVKKISVRVVCFIGCIFQFLSVSISSLVPNSVYLIVTQGIFYGCGHAFVYCPTLLLLSQYFEKRRPIAVTIASCGSCVGGIVFPYLTGHLLRSYGLQGTLLLLAGMLLQQLICIVAYTPPEDYKVLDRFESVVSDDDDVPIYRVSRQNITEPPSGQDILEESQSSPGATTPLIVTTLADPGEVLPELASIDDPGPPNLAFISKSHGQIPSIPVTKDSLWAGLLKQRVISKSHHVLPLSASESEKQQQHHHLHHHHHHHHRSDRHISTSTQFNQALSGSAADQINASMPSLLFNHNSALRDLLLESHHHQHHHHYHHHCGDQGKNLSSSQGALCVGTTDKDYQELSQNTDVECQAVEPSSQSCCKVPAVMKFPTFWVLCVFFVCGVVGTGHPAIFIPPLAIERGLTEEDASFFLMVSSFAEGFGRLIPGLILHLNLMKPTTVIIFPLLTCALTYHLTPLFTEFTSLMAFTLIYGLLNSCFWSLQTLIVIEVLGLSRLASAIGFYSIFMGVSSTIAFPLGGALKDVTGTYSSTFHFFGILYFMAAAAIFGIQFMKKENIADNDDEKRSNHNDDDAAHDFDDNGNETKIADSDVANEFHKAKIHQNEPQDSRERHQLESW